ncbi:bifunctional folylpolyglutamate synthase/dihydrofolate synthase [Candidatus Anaplasma sp. TIGMIC]|uniref:bifunctional folylpolyglutamate synthase/dihydrofolate synthase n=1 Tax=Candidatus Anaplasma sp. TIGMIC TaxID=3020713 RepID=UPI00232B18F5|nr:folylpolyglutamate synthase/dihydrofolate synthase family protein [Candidatus Anaplasma sp. TIGMIC]MDB1135417.1 bifunctional folylpolyglutamate synthase/dihydrofolate synthase [Candidatus Anaplasma sp. TIGMIC]
MVYMPHWPKVLEVKPERPTLDRMREILARLGDPEKRMPPVIHVAGTNGKGSTIAFLYHILKASGLRVHVYTSPHLLEFNERIVLNGTKIADSYLYEILEECRVCVEDLTVTFFEATTAAAFLAFSRVDADIVLVEVGMGGRLDATNIVTPILTVITSISLDHTSFLGNTVELIAGEKSGILKEGVTCVLAAQKFESAKRTVEFHAAENRAPIYRHGDEWSCKKDEGSLVFRSSEEYVFPLPSLAGEHQVYNAGNAIAACSVLTGKFGYDICHEDMEKGIESTVWPARLERITSGALYRMLPEHWKLFLDGAHNPAGAEALSDWIGTHMKHEDVYVIIGMTKEKDCKEFLSHLKKHIRYLCAVCVKAEYRAQPAEDIMRDAVSLGISASAEEDIRSSIDKIISIGDTSYDSTILVCGSLFLAGDLARESLCD